MSEERRAAMLEVPQPGPPWSGKALLPQAGPPLGLEGGCSCMGCPVPEGACCMPGNSRLAAAPKGGGPLCDWRGTAYGQHAAWYCEQHVTCVRSVAHVYGTLHTTLSSG